jgi:arsenate reductase-like glutaredoxin family protein
MSKLKKLQIALLEAKIEKLTGKKITYKESLNLNEGFSKETIKDLLSDSEGKTMHDILTTLNIPIETPANAQQVSIYMILKKLLDNNEIYRIKSPTNKKTFLYYLGSAPEEINNTSNDSEEESISKPTKKDLDLTPEEIFDLVNSLWTFGNKWTKSNSSTDKELVLELIAPKTGSKLEDEKGNLLSEPEIEKIVRPFKNHYGGFLEWIVYKLKQEGINAQAGFNYNKNGKITLKLNIIL